MKAKKLVGIFNIVVSALLFSIIFLSTIYELSAYSAYVNSLEEASLGEGLAVIVILLFMIFSAPLCLVFFILTLISGVKTLRKNCGKGMVIMGDVAKILASAGLSLLFIIYIGLYPAGWISKATYLFTAILALGSSVFDFVVIRHFQKVSPTSQEEVITEAETESTEEIAPTEE